MKRFLITLAVALFTLPVSAQNIPAKMRVEIADIEQNDDSYTIFQYKDADDEAVSYYLALSTDLGGFDFSIGDDISGGIHDFDETCIFMGTNLSEAMSFLDTILDLFDQQPGTSLELACRPTLPFEGMGEYGTATCTLVKGLFGKHLNVAFKGRNNRDALVELTRGNVRSLMTSLKIDRKLHPDW
ncbi:MAG: hypothetical protein IJK19_05180 [Bacteroidales bacterium]|nr:hypothetical protein [Bacteroidales bacterium]